MTEKEMTDRKVLQRYLNRIIDSELGNPEPDMDLISECNAFLDEIERGKYEPDLQIRHNEIKKLYESYRAAYGDQKHRNRTGRTRWSKIAVAACFCLFILIVPITAGAMNGLTPIEILERIGNKILSWNIGEEVEINNMTFIRHGEATVYDSIEECIKEEQLGIYCPTWLTEGTVIESVILFSEAEGESIIFKFSDPTIALEISLYQVEYSFVEENSDYHAIDINGKTAYCIIRGEGYYGVLTLDGYQYSVAAPDLDTVVNILQGLERTE